MAIPPLIWKGHWSVVLEPDTRTAGRNSARTEFRSVDLPLRPGSELGASVGSPRIPTSYPPSLHLVRADRRRGPRSCVDERFPQMEALAPRDSKPPRCLLDAGGRRRPGPRRVESEIHGPSKLAGNHLGDPAGAEAVPLAKPPVRS
jgi:hypothetical protein